MSISDVVRVVYAIILCVLTVVIVVSNTFCIVVLWKVRSIINEAPQVLMTSLSLADLLNGLFCVLPLFVVYLLPKLSALEADACRLQALLFQIIQVIKVMLLLALNFDRYIAVTRALRYHDIVTPRRVYIGIAAIWILSFVSSLIYATAVEWNVASDAKNIELCVFKLDVENPLHWMDLIVFVILPLIVTVVIYIRLSKLARHHMAQIGVVANEGINQDDQRRLALQNQAQKASKTTRVMTLVFVLTCCPTILAKLFYQFSWVLNCLLILSFCSGFANIGVYFYRNSIIRATSRAMLRNRRLQCQQILPSSFTRARQFFSRIFTRNNQPASQLDSEVQNLPVPSPQSDNN